VLRWPARVEPGRTSDLHASLLDILPTFLSAAGISRPEGLAGQDLVDRLAGRVPDREGACVEVQSINGPLRAFRTRQWKYIQYENGGFEELYDLSADPGELHNLAGDPRFHSRRSELRAMLVEQLARDSTPELSQSGGDLKECPHTPLDPVPGFRPYSRMPWETRDPPVTIQNLEDVSWWWARQPQKDWTCMFDRT